MLPLSSMPSPRRQSLKRPRPGRLQLQLNISNPGSSTIGVCTPPLSPISSNCPISTTKKQRIVGGFSYFAASYPQYCESKCPAATDLNGSCCQLVEPSFSINHGPTQLLSFLYVGSQTDAIDAEVINRLGITHVLNVSANCPQSQHIPAGNFMRVPVNDGYADKLLPHFKRAFHFLENVRQTNGRCLVHCLAGVSRSPTLTIAYIMQHKRMSQDEAYRYVKALRPSISPNFNFLGQLMEFERQLMQQQQHEQQNAAADATNAGLEPPDSAVSFPEAKRQRTLFPLLREAAPPIAASASGQSPTSALSRLTFAVHQQQQQQRRRQRPRSVAITGQAESVAPTAATSVTTIAPASSSMSASASLSGSSQEITCS